MNITLDKVRLRVSTVLMWIAYRIAPSEIASIFEGYTYAVEALPGELKKGRTYGVITGVWSLTEEGYALGERMQSEAMSAIAHERWWIEEGCKLLRPCGEITLPPSNDSPTNPNYGIDL